MILINLRQKDIDYEKRIIFVRGGKKDRTTTLADNTILALKKHTEIYIQVRSHSLAKIKSPFDVLIESKTSNKKG